jgi:hypothetical protein
MPAVTRKESPPGQRKTKKRHRKKGAEGEERHEPRIQKVESEDRQGERCHEQCTVEGCGCRYAGLGFRV